MKYKKAGMGGTFDHFHTGHQQFIEFASQQAEHLVIGITTAELLTKKLYSQSIEPFEVRKKSVEDFCNELQISYEVFPLNDVYGPTLSDPEIDVIIATESTRTGAESINSERVNRGLRPLSLEKATLSHDKANLVISSERIRAGEINRQGLVYKSIFAHDLTLNEEQRQFFTKPQGKIITTSSESAFTCLVGDTTMETFIKNGWKYELAFFDYLKKRASYSPVIIESDKTDLCAWSQPGSISQTLSETIQYAFEHKLKQIFIHGEEDLAAVAAVLLLPLSSHIYYGQPDVGMVELVVTEEKKEAVYGVLKNI